jgi:16S rRNA (guanine527-N7)-methyltransferase
MEIPRDDASILEQGAERLGVKVPDKARSLFISYCEEIEFWSPIAGITAYRTRQELLIHMVLDSLAAVKLIQALPHAQVLDLGTGGGFPGLPCRILSPAMRLTLLDSSTRKTEFLENLVKKLDIGGVRVLCARAGRLPQMISEKGRYDIVMTRAFASLSEIVRLSAPLLCPEGRVMAWKGPRVAMEIEDCQPLCIDLAMEVEEIYRYTLPFVDQEMNIAVLRKRN